MCNSAESKPLLLLILLVAILNELLQRENRVLHFWTMKKRRLDQCQQYVVFERSAKQVRFINLERSTFTHAHTAICVVMAPSGHLNQKNTSVICNECTFKNLTPFICLLFLLHFLTPATFLHLHVAGVRLASGHGRMFPFHSQLSRRLS